jgi:cell division protein FtsQ
MEDFDYNRPNTRARIAARRKRANLPQDESGVLPGPRRTMVGWLASGRILSLPLLVVALGTLLYVTTNPRFTIQDIQVQGTNLLHSDDVIRLSGARGHSIWLIDTQQIIANIAANAYVEQASAAVILPDRLTIVIRERKPEVRWKSGTQLLLVDANGRVLGPDTSVPMTGTLVIDDRSGQVLNPNDQIDPHALELGRTLSLRLPNELRLTPEQIGWGSDTGIVVQLSGGRTVVFGQDDHVDSKLAILAKLTTDHVLFTYLDLRPETPYYRNDK